MDKIKNYKVKFMGGTDKDITKEHADAIFKAWSGGSKLIVLEGEVFAVHQILSINKRTRSELYDLKSDLVKHGYLPKGDDLDEGIAKQFQELQKQLVMDFSLELTIKSLDLFKNLTRPKND